MAQQAQPERRRIVDPIIYITPDAKALLDIYIDLAEGEVSGLGEVERFGKRDFLIRKIYLLPQVCTDYDTKITKEGLKNFLLDLIRDGEDLGKIKLWWHSHGYLEVFWSMMTDCQTIERFNNQWMVSVVGNKAGDLLGRVDVYAPVRVTQDNLSVRVLLPTDEEILALASEEVKEKVTFQKEKDQQEGVKSKPKNYNLRRRGMHA